MSRRMTDKDEVLPALLGRAVTDVVVDESLIRATRWSAVDLAALSAASARTTPPAGRRPGVDARTSAPVRLGGSEVSPTPARDGSVASEDRTFVELVGARRLARVTRVSAPEDAVTPPRAAAAAPRPAAPAPLSVMPLPAPRGVAWQSRPALDSSAIVANKKNARSLIFLMIALWSAIVAVGVYKSVTPPSGYDLRWGD